MLQCLYRKGNSFVRFEKELKSVLIQTLKMTQEINRRVALKTVQEYFSNQDILHFEVYRCMQNIYNKKNIEESHHCIAEFTSEKFNLHTSKIHPNVNVPYDKCINVRVLTENGDAYKNNDRVQCVLCNTIVGCVYLDTIALCKNVYKTSVATLPEYEQPIQLPPSILDRLPKRVSDWRFTPTTMPRNLHEWEMTKILVETRNENVYQQKAKKDLPFLYKYLNHELQGLKSYSDFVMVCSNHVIFFVLINMTNFFFHRNLNTAILMWSPRIRFS